MQLDVASLRTFLAVLDFGGMTAAAGELDTSQSAVSWKIKRLEERIGRPLLIRQGRTLRPTRDGRALLEDARVIVDTHDRAVGRLVSTELTGRVKLGANEEVGATNMAGLLARFRRMHPATTVEVVIASSRRLGHLIDDGELDVAVMQVNDEQLLADDRMLWTDALHWVTCCEAPYDDGPVPMITFGDDCFYRGASEPVLKESGIEYNVTFSGSSSAGVQAAVEAGLGIAVLSSRFICGDIVEWARGKSLGELPNVHQIARTVPGEHPKVAEALVDAIVAQLREPEQLVNQGASSPADARCR